jgi:hypothetical protein
MVQELSAATAVEVEREFAHRRVRTFSLTPLLGHVASMNAALKEKREELDRLESERKEAEQTIADLLRLQLRYKGPASVSMMPRGAEGHATDH